MALVTQRLIVIIRAALRAEANQVAQVADPTTDGGTFTVPLRLATDTAADPAVVGYWTSWALTDEQRARLVDEFGSRVGEVIVPIPLGGVVDPSADYWFFEAADGQWSASDALAALGWALMPSGES